MGAFDYVAVLISIVLGLGITNVLTGLAGIVRARDRVTMFAPTVILLVDVFVIHVQMWWSMFGLREVRHWNFASFLAVLMQPVLIYMVSAFLVPAIPEKGPVDLKAQYFREHAWVFGALILTLGDSLLRNVLLAGHLPEPPDLAAHGAFFVLSVVGMLSRGPRVQLALALALATTALLVVYVGALFMQLR
ncbi:MAG TPA: hypothetical protein VG387_14260 [Rhizomicrobium sp.]|nr:hypothetical protein [Rhizomicrobium sp.]